MYHRFLKICNFIFFLFLLIFFSCSQNLKYVAGTKSKNNDNYRTGQKFEGKASYYGKKFHGRKTSSGEIFDMYKKTAAHRSLPFGTRVKVTNLQNGMSVVVKINDRGPFKAGRIIDLSYVAAKEIDMIRSGVAEVIVKILEIGN